MEATESRLAFDLSLAESIEALIRAYPAWLAVEDIPRDAELPSAEPVVDLAEALVGEGVLVFRE